jgi:hypothetical protein
MIKNMTHEDVLETNFQWGEHLWFEVPLEGGSAALQHHSEYAGYGFLSYMDEEDTWLTVSDIPAHPDGIDAVNIGDMVHLYDEDRKLHFHAVYTHSVANGYYTRFYRNDAITPKLDAWWAENEADIVWPMRLIRFGGGKQLRRYFDNELGAQVDTNVLLTPLAKTEAEFHIYWTD